MTDFKNDDREGNNAIAQKDPVEMVPEVRPLHGFVKSAQFGDTDPAMIASNILRFWGVPERTFQFWKGSMWRWNGSCYRQVRDDEFRAFTHAMIQMFYFEGPRDKKGQVKQVRPAQVTAVIDAFKSQVRVPSEIELPIWLDYTGARCNMHTDPLGYIALANGIVSVSEATAGSCTPEPLTPMYFSTVVLPYAYGPTAECPRFESFLQQIMQGDQERVDYLQEFIGYCLIPDARFHAFMVLEGSGANGKSVLLKVIEELLGRENVSHVPLERFADRFALGSTIGKLANIVQEAEDVPKGVTGILKQFTAGDRMTLDLKHKTPVEVAPKARLIIASNARLKFSDSSEGLWRRMNPIPCLVVIPKEEQNPNLANELCEELPGIFNWSLKGLRRLLARRRFEIPSISKEMLAEYKVETNSARRFLEDAYAVGEGETLTIVAYSDYQNWCEDTGEVAVTDRRFGQEIKAIFGERVKRARESTGLRRWIYRGLVKAA